MRFKSKEQQAAVMMNMGNGGTAGRFSQPSPLNLPKNVAALQGKKLKVIKSPEQITTEKNIKQFDKDQLTEREVKLLQRRVNDKKIPISKIPRVEDGEGYDLSQDQNEKGRKWLMNKWKSPTGKERANNPFGAREEDILKNFKEIRLKDFYSERGNWYSPYYEVVSKDGSTFEYAVVGGEPQIMG